ncbi:inorganic phosphate transporter [Candidatus Thorarchaeota archaeon]|nr:MAG: inorganic phosphate transporter [Candidatus Thorarchaeota archaeon]
MAVDLLVLGSLLVIGFVVAFAVGSNDETMAPAVGAGVFTIKVAVTIGGLIAIFGAVTLGSGVSETVGSELVGGQQLETGMVFAILISMAIWLLIASITKGLPISTTQCVVGSVIGVASVAPLLGHSEWGFNQIDWFVVLRIFSGWILSPIIGFLISGGVYSIFRRAQRRAAGLTRLERQERIAAYALAVFLVLTAMSRGGNDVANAVAPLVSLDAFSGSYVLGPLVIPGFLVPLLVGGLGMALGLVVVGRRVIKTLATEVVTLSPSSALSASVSVFLVMFFGTLLGLPLSGTHVLVAGLIAVGWVSEKPVQMKQVREIIISWIITIPIAGALGIAVFGLIGFLF